MMNHVEKQSVQSALLVPGKIEPMDRFGLRDRAERVKRELRTIPGFAELGEIVVDRLFASLDMLLDYEERMLLSSQELEEQGRRPTEDWYVYRMYLLKFQKLAELLFAQGRTLLRDELYRRNLALELAEILDEEIPDGEVKKRVIKRLRAWARTRSA